MEKEYTPNFGIHALLNENNFHETFPDAVMLAMAENKCSIVMLMIHLKVDFETAFTMIHQMEDMGIVGTINPLGTRPVLITQKEADGILQKIASGCGKNEIIKSKKKAEIGIDQIIKDEQERLRKQRGLSTVENEFIKVDAMKGREFEYWCADRLRNAGFFGVSVTPESNDMGVDVLATKDEIKYAFQCKCYASDLGNTPVQEVNAGKSYYRCHVGVVMTNRYFTKGAKNLASATGTLLWDRDYIRKILEEEYGDQP